MNLAGFWVCSRRCAFRNHLISASLAWKAKREGRVCAGRRLQRPHCLDRRPDLGAGQHLGRRPVPVRVERHELDEPHLVGVLAGEAGKRDDLVLGEVPDRDRVDLDRVGLGVGAKGGEAAEHLRQRVAPGHVEEAVLLERVDRDVEARDPGGRERRRVALEQVAVRRHREVLEPVDGGEAGGQGGELLPNERLAAGQPHIGDAERDEQRDEALDLLEREDAGPFEPRQALGRHAVLAAEVAAVGDRDAKVADGAPVRVAKRLPRARRGGR